MAPVTELILLPLSPNASPETISSVIATNTATLLAQPGCRRVRASRVHEDASKQRLFVDWDSLEQHRAFGSNDEEYGPFRARMAGIVDTSAGPRKPPYHVEFAPAPPSVLDGSGRAKAPVAEVLHAYFPSDVNEQARARIAGTVHEFVAELAKFAEGYTREYAVGWTVENDLEFKGEKTRALLLVVGWTSVEAHFKGREDEGFAKIIPMIRGLEGLKGLEMCHVANTTTEKSA
ncbi:uncharacterized protein F4822DRAFT_319280 [Hypoxylon trugodes]|uniref:uncharacterized protein n=1 Tax=Hypoxylon trugodes TaxID=326681 RepID=UPI0021916520|nr:uncharacterized protein F4822DRAFT_319280 [Hypoxylon trugodes]KAI1386523.1 hypothetical protein F4822DRAFT_319280 [Hypoxylon trugodes]